MRAVLLTPSIQAIVAATVEVATEAAVVGILLLLPRATVRPVTL